MPRQNMASPISVLVGGVIVIILLLASSGANTSAIALRQNNTPTWTPCDDEDDDCITFQDDAFATADSLTETADAESYPAATSSGYDGPATSTSAANTQATSGAANGSPTARTTPTSTRGTSTPTPTRLATTESSSEVQRDAVTPTLAPAPSDAMVCTPGVPIEISGEGPPRAPVLLYFGDRAVGGGSVAPNGRFALKLIIGQERAGEYKVTARVRGTSQVLTTVTCSVPILAPTPRPSAFDR